MQPGDTLSGIAARTLGDPNQYGDIAAANQIADPNTIRPGQQINVNLPAPARTPPTGEDIRDLRSTGGSGYQVQPGDTWDSVAATFGLPAADLVQRNELPASADLVSGMLLIVPRPT